MFRNPIVRWGTVTALLLVALAGSFYIVSYIQGGSGEASAPIAAPQLALPSTTSVAAATAVEVSPAAPEPPGSTVITSALTLTAAATTPSATAPAPAPPSAATLFRIISEASEVRFEIEEILRGQPTTAIGRTNQVAGDLIIDFANPANSNLGTIRINVRTLETPEQNRDRVIRSRILQSSQDAYEFAEFVPSALVGLPTSIEVGQTMTFQIVGDLTLKGIAAPVTFDATVTVVAEDRVEGEATATVQRETFDLMIPSVPFVADVSEDVVLGITFVAERVQG